MKVLIPLMLFSRPIFQNKRNREVVLFTCVSYLATDFMSRYLSPEVAYVVILYCIIYSRVSYLRPKTINYTVVILFLEVMVALKRAVCCEEDLELLAAETVQGTALAFQGVDYVHCGYRLPLCMLAVCNCITDDIF